MNIDVIRPYLPLLHALELSFAEELKYTFTESEIAHIIRNANEHFEQIKKVIPDIDNSSPWLKNLLGISYEIGVWKELEKRGFSLNSISVITQKALKVLSAQSIPKERIPEIRSFMCSEKYVKQIASASQEKTNGEDWLFECILPSKKDTFNIGMNIYRCPVSVLCKRLNVEPYFPYFCINDYVTHYALGIQLTRTQTLAHGNSCCDFRLTANGAIYENIIYNPEQLPEFNHNKL